MRRMSTERHTVKVASYAILRRDNEVLLLRRQGSGYYDGWYSLPAGHIETGEYPLDTAVREAKEEVGIQGEAKDFLHVHTLYRLNEPSEKDYIDFFFAVTSWEGEARIGEPEKCDDVRWFRIDALPENTIPYIRETLHMIGEGVAFSQTLTRDGYPERSS